MLLNLQTGFFKDAASPWWYTPKTSQASLSSNARVKFECGEIHAISWEPCLPCSEMHLPNLGSLHYVLVAVLCSILNQIFSASDRDYQLSYCVSYVSLFQMMVACYCCVLSVFTSVLETGRQFATFFNANAIWKYSVFFCPVFLYITMHVS